MKVIVAGATGAAGQAATQQCLEDDRITKVIILTRKAVSLDIESHPKAQVMMHQDFSRYSNELMHSLEGAEACLWAIGGKVKQFKNEKGSCHEVYVDYTLAAANAMLRHLASKTPNGKPFRFVLCSCKWAEKQQHRSLLFMADVRRARGAAEKALYELADVNKGKLDVWILRPGCFVSPSASLSKRILGSVFGGIKTAQVGKAMVRVGREGWQNRMIENRTIQKM